MNPCVPKGLCTVLPDCTLVSCLHLPSPVYGELCEVISYIFVVPGHSLSHRKASKMFNKVAQLVKQLLILTLDFGS